MSAAEPDPRTTPGDPALPHGTGPEPESESESEPRRMFLHEPGWSVVLKSGSEREFCYMMAPGQDYYHRLLDREVYLVRGDERLCLACAQRRGLLSFEPRHLRQSLIPFALDFEPRDDPDAGLPLKPIDDD